MFKIVGAAGHPAISIHCQQVPAFLVARRAMAAVRSEIGSLNCTIFKIDTAPEPLRFAEQLPVVPGIKVCAQEAAGDASRSRRK